MITSLISEREGTQNEAIWEVSQKWANSQTINGPFISIPYYKYVKENNNNSKDTNVRLVKVKSFFHVLPNELKINGEIDPEKLNRGIFDIVVYNSKLKIEGNFKIPNIKNFDIPANSLQYENAQFNIGLSDLRGIEEQINLQWDQSIQSFNSGIESNDVVEKGIHASIPLEANDSAIHKFSFELDLKGSQLLYFTPVGKTTDVNISSKWTNPSFNGSFLPDKRNSDANGFTANWNVLHLNRNYPQAWTGSDYNIEPSSFGIDLLLPVDNYQKSYRSIKYALLFIAFTFVLFFFIEILKKVFIHPIQYILVGIALVIFYTLLLSIGEHIAFNYAFIISALATMLLISGYIKAILKSNTLVLLITGILAILYGFIFIIIQVQDYALLIGSIGIFLILALVMYFSRKIDWYHIQLKENE